METQAINPNEVKKELYKSKVNANLSHYNHGNLYYTVQLESGLYQFPIKTVEPCPEGDYKHFTDNALYELSTDLGTTDFHASVKASELNRWITFAIGNGNFVKID